MKFRPSILLAATAIVAVSSMVSAHQDDDPDDGGRLAAWTALAATAGDRAAALSNAPRTHAPCIDGLAAETYPCDGIDMLSFIDIGTLGLSFVNDMWGWTDPLTGKDYALLGAIEGTTAIDVSDPKRPVIVGLLPTASTAGGQVWRDIKVFQNHAFIVSEHDGHGMQVLDLNVLRDVDTSAGPVTLPEATRYNGFSSAHNIAINEDTGFAYVVGADTCSGGLEMIDIGNPTAPAAAGCFDGHGYIHDTQCVIYNGPDADYLGRELCFSSASNRISSGPSRFLTTVSIVDVTDKLAPVEIANQSYGTGAGYSHQGWLTPDHAIFVHGDELDELFGAVETTTTRIWDISDLDAATLLAETTNGNTSIDHNIYIEGRYSFASNYTSGLRVIDIRDIADGSYEEVGFFDVYPENDNASFEGGTWSNYPFFSQAGLIAVSSIDRGLFLLQARIGRGDD